MNSSVTFDSAISVTSSLCLPISCSSRSNGPSKFVSLTVKRAGAASTASGAADAAPVLPLTGASVGGPPAGSRRELASGGGQEGSLSLPAQAADQHRLVAALAQVRQQDRDGLANDAAAVGRDPVLSAEGQPGALQGQELVRGDVDGDLLVVLRAVRTAGGPAAGGDGRPQHPRPLRGAAGARERVVLRRRSPGHQGERHAGQGLPRLLTGAPGRTGTPQRG